MASGDENREPLPLFVAQSPGRSRGELKLRSGGHNDLYTIDADASQSPATSLTPEYMPFKGADGWQMDGWIMKPQNIRLRKRYLTLHERSRASSRGQE